MDGLWDSRAGCWGPWLLGSAHHIHVILCGCLHVLENLNHSGRNFCGDVAKWEQLQGGLTWWVMAGVDDHTCMCGMDEVASPNSQVEYLETKCNLVLQWANDRV